MHVLLVSIGTGGDIFPYIGLGKVLRARGHQVTLVAPEDFAALAADHQLAFRPVVSVEQNHKLLSNPDFWHPIKAGGVAARWGMRLVELQYKLISQLASGEQTVLVSNPGLVAATIAAEKLRRPIANLILQPWMIPSSIAPPVIFDCHFPRATPRWVLDLFWGFIASAGDLLVRKQINRVRISIGLSPVRRFLKDWFSRELVIGMFPEWYGPPQADWPSQVRLTGFPMFDGSVREGLPADLEKFCRAGKPPIVFTFGTGMMHASKIYLAAIEACRALGARAIFLTKYTNQVPASLPPFVQHSDFAPFQELFPLCAAVVHHGGIGTVAKSLAAGVPQLILPFAFDQTDNGARVKRLGTGDWLKQSKITGRSIADRLAGLLTPQTRDRCRLVAKRFDVEDSLTVAADLVEKLAERRLAQSTVG